MTGHDHQWGEARPFRRQGLLQESLRLMARVTALELVSKRGTARLVSLCRQRERLL